jgi:subtilase family serine protease
MGANARVAANAAGPADGDGGFVDEGGFLDDGGVESGVDSGPPGLAWFPAPPGEFYFGAGGGTSILFAQPTWQKGIVPASIANLPGVPARAVPDVGMLADPVTGFIIGQTVPGGAYQEYAIGGTSLSSPLFMGAVALAEQNAGKKFGFMNPLLYKASSKGAFVDIKPLASPQASTIYPGLVATYDYEGQSIHTLAGYDTVTGLGAPNGTKFLSALK